MGIARGETLPIQGGGANLLLLEQVEIFKNDRSEPTQGRDVDAGFLGQLHGIEHLAPGRFETAQHLRNKAGIDVGPLNRLPRGACERDALDKHGRGTAPHVEVAFGVLRKAQGKGLAAGLLKTGGVTD